MSEKKKNMLEINGLIKHFGGLAAIDGLDMTINQGEIVGIIGPNGAGKTTLFNLITGFLHPTEGQILFEGRDIIGKKPHKIAEKGIIRTFQLTNLFPQFTVLENVVASCHMKPRIGFWEGAFHTPGSRKKAEQVLYKSQEILEFTGLESRANQLAGGLSSGWRRTLAIAIALAASPRLLLLDEPVTTLDPERVTFIMNLITKVRESGVTVAIIEHNMRAIMDYCDRIVVIGFGKKIAEGTCEEIRQHRDVIKAYLGE
jgi:branched-chain amino acid transport system ATP-binding protein